MPCNSDYMYPTQAEINRLHEKELALKEIADRMVFNADVIRDLLLENKGKLTKTAQVAAGMVGKYIGEYDGLRQRGESARIAVVNEYAASRNNSTIKTYEKAHDQYAYLIPIAGRFLAGEKVYAKEYKDVEKQQIEHRKGDIQRLVTVFNDRGDWKMLKKVINVDFTQPLEPQLGFSPDDY